MAFRSLFSLFLFPVFMLTEGCQLNPPEDKKNTEIIKPQHAITLTRYEQLLDALPGRYSNRIQYEMADESFKIKPSIGGKEPWIDYQYATFKRVDVPAVPGKSIALEWRAGGPNGDISRQRIWSFRHQETQAFMDFYSLKKPIDFNDPAAFSMLTNNDLISYGSQCALPVENIENGFHLSIPETCRIVSRSGRNMILTANITITDTISYKESGRLIDGTSIFEVPGLEAYKFVSVQANK